MPELPDLTLYARNLNHLFVDKKITSFTSLSPKLCPIDSDDYKGLTLNGVMRMGKRLYFDFGERGFFLHLMLTGELMTTDKGDHRIFVIHFIDKEGNYSILALRDENNMAKLEEHLGNSPTEDDIVPDALSEKFSFDYLKSIQTKSPKRNIKAILIDQSIVGGIGNAYCDEILYGTTISPLSLIGAIPYEKLTELVFATKQVLSWAIQTLTEVVPNAISGEYRGFLKVHRKDLTKTEKGEEIICTKVASKKTYYTATQILYN